MSKRFFSFGCSFTALWWPTWNDYIGLNFDEYHNFGCGGADNKNILYRFLIADKKYKFTSDDYIMIMFTSFNRLSYVDKDNFYIYNIGDLVDHNLKVHPIGKNYNFATAIYDSCIMIQSLKTILDAKNIKYKFLQSMEHDFYNDNFKTEGDVETLLKDTLNLFEYPVMETWCYLNYDFNKERVIWQDTKHQDGHPLLHHHYDFVKEFFPHFINEKVEQYYKEQQEFFTMESSHIQSKRYTQHTDEFFKNNNIIYTRY